MNALLFRRPITRTPVTRRKDYTGIARGYQKNDVWLSVAHHRKTYFAMLVTGGIILTRLNEPEKERLLKDPGVGYFEGHGGVMKKWVRISVSSPSDIDSCIPSIRSSYETAQDEKTYV